MKINPVTYNPHNHKTKQNAPRKNLHTITPANKSSNVPFLGYCTEENFEIKKLYNIPCPVCGIVMFNQKQIQNFIKETQNATGEDLIKTIKKYDKFFHTKEKRILELIKYEAKIDPEKNISQIIKEQYEKTRNKTKKEQIKALRELGQFLQSQKHADFKQIKNIIETYIKSLKEDEDFLIDKKSLMKDLKIFFESNKVNQETLRKILLRFPDTKNNFEFFKTFHNASSRKIAYILACENLSTCEHIIPKAKNGQDDTANYLAQCAHCNSTRGSLDFSDWVRNNTDFKVNFQRYLEEVSKNINLNHLPDEYDTYIEDVVETIDKQMNDRMKFKDLITKLDPTGMQNQESVKARESKEKTPDIKNIEKNLSKKKEKLKELLSLQETLNNHGENHIFIELSEAYKNLRKIESQIAKYREISAKQKALSEKTKNKEEKLKQLTLELEETKNSQVRKKLKSKIAKLENSLKQLNSRSFEEKLKLGQEPIKTLIQQEHKIEERIKHLKNNSNFSDNINGTIKLSELNTKIELLSKEITKIEKILEKYKKGKLTLNQAINLFNQIESHT